MDNNIFNLSPSSYNKKSIYPGDRGILLFYNDGNIKEIYGREHAIMMQKIGYWYIDNWQDFLLNFSYNNIIVVMFEFDTSLVYLPKNISIEQKQSMFDYIKKNILINNRGLIKFYVMRCLEVNDSSKVFDGIERDNRGMIKKIKGKDITEDKPITFDELCSYLNSDFKINNNSKIRVLSD